MNRGVILLLGQVPFQAKYIEATVTTIVLDKWRRLRLVRLADPASCMLLEGHGRTFFGP